MDFGPLGRPVSGVASQDLVPAGELSAAMESQRQEAAKLTRSELAAQRFQELETKVQRTGTIPVIIKLRAAFRPEGELARVAEMMAQRGSIKLAQDELMNDLSGSDPASIKRFDYVPYLAAKVDPAGLAALRSSASVLDIEEDRLLRPTLAESVPLIGAPNAWAIGYTGLGKVVAILDTGVDKTHPYLTGKVVSEACYSSIDPVAHFTSVCPGGVTESTAAGSGVNCAIDGCFHGSHVAGIVAARSTNLNGVAKDANLISIQVFSLSDDDTTCEGPDPCVRAFNSDLIKGLNRVYALRDTYSIAAVNLSLGGDRFTSNCDNASPSFKNSVDLLRSVGIATVVASGNESYSDALSFPACISTAVSVGATGDGTDLSADQIASYSNTASFLNLLAPGDSITSLYPNNRLITASGTSMAAPHVAGAWAILKQRSPSAGVTQILNSLTSTGVGVTDPRTGITVPRIRVDAATGCAASVAADRWKGEYFSNRTLSGNPTMIRDDGNAFLDYDFGGGAPASPCGLPVDNFSIRWTRTVNFTVAGTYRFTMTGDDGVRLYVDGQLRIDKFIDQGPTTYTADISLTAGTHQLRMDYYEAGGGALARLSWNLLFNPACIATVATGRWKGEYFNNRTLSDTTVMVRDDGNGFLNFDFGGGSPSASCGVEVDNFSARWTRTVNFAAGTYRFSVTGDDGVRLYVDGQLRIDKFIDQGPTTYTVDLGLTAGNHDLKLEYYEAGGGAVARLSWESISNSSCFATVAASRWKGEYFNNRTLSDGPSMVRDDGEGFLDFDFGGGAPVSTCGLPVDNFSIRWTRTVNFAAGTYRFSVTGDDGVRLYIDGQLKIDQFVDQAPTLYSADVDLTAGNHEVKLEYYEAGGGAVARLSWAQVSGAACLATVAADRWKGEYFNNRTLAGSPILVRDDGPTSLNFDFGGGSPNSACGVPVDNFSTRWTRTVAFAAGTYRFSVTGDDGVRLYVDGQLKIDKFIDQGPTTYAADVALTAGNHEVKLEYYEAGGGAVARLSWAPVASLVARSR
ncbi:MAG TPA: PA14 domain-containing protein [Blastocatellia bacterium]|nr:PA14 domain-containing protein [Blastocatellia bacterium]